MIKSDKWIKRMARQGMICPFVEGQVRTVIEEFTPDSFDLVSDKRPGQLVAGASAKPAGTGERRRVITYGTGSYGYDMRLAGEFQTPRFDGPVLDPKGAQTMDEVFWDAKSGSVVMRPHSVLLGRAVEHFDIPKDVIAMVWGKSTYARLGLIINMTPLEPGWKGYPTICLVNPNPIGIRVYVNEGIAQVVFFSTDEACDVPYDDREGGGKYQDQGPEITGARA
jgi:dCTP deaminase